jgi:hypothetical protein
MADGRKLLFVEDAVWTEPAWTRHGEITVDLTKVSAAAPNPFPGGRASTAILLTPYPSWISLNDVTYDDFMAAWRAAIGER